MVKTAAWRVWIDTGGTFTDAVAVGPLGQTRRAKVLSTGALRGVVAQALGVSRFRIEHEWGGSGRGAGEAVEGWEPPDDLIRGYAFRRLGGAAAARVVGFDAAASTIELDCAVELAPGTPFEVAGEEPAPLLAVRLLTGTGAGEAIPPVRLRLATTRATNALLTRSGARVAHFITRGFGDLLEIGTQQRPDLFALRIVKPRALYETVVEVDERVSADGVVLRALDVSGLESRARELARAGVRSAAVALLHADRFPEHERLVGGLLRRVGFTHVSCSHEVAPFIRILPRAQTAVVDAYVAPVVGDYLAGIRRGLGGSPLYVLTSSGGLVADADFRAKDSLLSGPAGGVVGAGLAARRSGVARAISFDMGGTSTDVARLELHAGKSGSGGLDYVYEHTVADAHLVGAAVAVETVAAGGGSVCGFDGIRPKVGPESAGAAPGPACYGAGGPLTLTDVNLLLGRLDPARLPIPIDEQAARAALEEVKGRMWAAAPDEVLGDDALLGGFLDIAAERMAGAIRRVSTRAGYDPRDYTLVAFGGAGGQHACAVAARLGITSILMPADNGVLSAIGLGAAPIERDAQEQVLRPLSGAETEIDLLVSRLSERARRDVERSGGASPALRAICALRLVGQESSLEVEFARASDLDERFRQRYAGVYGHAPAADRAIELLWVRVVASAPEPVAESTPVQSAGAGTSAAENPPLRRAYFDGWRDVAAIDRESLPVGAAVEGPALIFEAHGALVLEAGWTARVDAAGALSLRQETSNAGDSPAVPASVRTELFSNRLESIAREMGEALRRTAVSTNVKERLDYSCAILDAHGELIVNAPHVPVHLGSLGLCVRSVREAIAIGPGDVVITNHPALGGSHLPDITAITGVFSGGGRLIAYAASRAHHAEIGGVRPGSMPPGARALAEEGVVITPMYLVKAGSPRHDDVARLLLSGPHPTRCVSDNLADLLAAAAANQRGATALLELAGQIGDDAVARMMDAMKDRAEQAARRALARIGDREFIAHEDLDDGSPIRVTIAIRDGEAAIDFAGSAGVHPGNLNATPAIVRSAVIYVLRLLVQEDLPLNEGLMRAVRLEIPPGMLNPVFDADPRKAPAVVGGNVETSQRLVDTLLKALGVCACSQGTMNNVVFGGGSGGGLSYYETVCGGSGAGPGFGGASAVHTHMTNTRITDPEILETRYPVRLARFEIRRGSGGAGRWRGGDGAVREVVFLAPLSLSILSQHRASGPYGLAGGSAGLPGSQRLVRADGQVVHLGPIDGCEALPGDRLILQTPGGGGYGAPGGTTT